MNQSILPGHYDWGLVALSILIAVCASYTGLDLAGRTTKSTGRNRVWWLVAGSIAMGLGIWAMHYIGMLAYQLPVMVLYSLPTVAFSLLAAIAASAVAFFVVSRKQLSKLNLAGGSLAMGAGIAAMHYSGMAAMHLAAHRVYRPALVAISVVIAVTVSCVALNLTFRLRDRDKVSPWARPLSALAMGFAIALMHYTGMAAVSFQHAGPAASSVTLIPVTSLGIGGIVVVTFGVLALCLVGSMADRNFSRQRQALEADQERWRLLVSANPDGIFDADLVSGKAIYSARWLAMFGYQPDELPQLGETWSQLLHPDDRSWVQARVSEYFKTPQGPLELEYRVIHRDGSTIWMLARSQAVWNPEGRPVRLVGSHTDITARNRALAELQASQARFSAFMEHSPSIAFIKDAGGKLVYLNSTAERLWNFQPGQWLGKSDQQLLPADVAESFREKDEAALASESHREDVETVRMPDGVVRQFLVTRFSFPESQGRKALGGFAVDITDRSKTEERMRASERRYRELFERNPLPSWIYGLKDLRLLDVNQAAIDHYGWSREEFVGLHVSSIRVPGEVEIVEVELRECSAHRTRTKPLRHRRNNKTDIWVELSSHELECEGQRARLVMSNDVTAHIEMEKAIQRSHHQLESLVADRTSELESSKAKWHGLVEALPQCVWTTTPDGFCDYMSPQWTEFTGVSQPNLLGLGWLKTLHPDDEQQVQEFRLAARKGAQPYDFEYRIRSREGRYRWFVARGRPVFAAAGGPVTHWLGTSTDIDDQKRGNEVLEKAVAERTIALADALDRAECAARAKSEFLATMSHEIRTPMNGVIGMTQLMFDTSLTAQQQLFLNTIQSSGQALLAIIDDILDFSKIEAGEVKIEHATFGLRTLLQQSIDLVSPDAAKKSLQLSIRMEHRIPAEAIGDAGRLRQIILNLLSNAVKFTQRGSVLLSLSLEAQKDSLMTLRFAVRDTGIGLSPEQQRNLFHAFSQADLSTTRRFGGTGLGLAIAKRLVELMGGTIGVSSELGAGATFWFQICVNQADSPHPGSQPLPDSFVHDMPMQIHTLVRLLQDGCAQDVQRQAQIIEGASARAGEEALRELARQIRQAAGAGDLATAKSRLTGLEVAFIRLKEALRMRAATPTIQDHRQLQN